MLRQILPQLFSLDEAGVNLYDMGRKRGKC